MGLSGEGSGLRQRGADPGCGRSLGGLPGPGHREWARPAWAREQLAWGVGAPPALRESLGARLGAEGPGVALRGPAGPAGVCGGGRAQDPGLSQPAAFSKHLLCTDPAISPLAPPSLEGHFGCPAFTDRAEAGRVGRPGPFSPGHRPKAQGQPGSGGRQPQRRALGPAQCPRGATRPPGAPGQGCGPGRAGGGPGERAASRPPPPCPSAGAPSTHRAPGTSLREPVWRQRPGPPDRYGHCPREQPGGPQRGGGGAARGRPAPAPVARAMALSRRGPPGHCPGHTGRATHQMAVCCRSQFSGGRVKECGSAAGRGAICSSGRGHWAGTARPAGRPGLHGWL